MTANAADFGSSALSAFGRAIAVLALTVGAALAFVFAFVAAVVVGLMVLGAALAIRFAPRRPSTATPGVLDARQTPTGWVVETTRRKA